MMKKLLAFLMIFVLCVIPLSACGSSSSDDAADDTTQAAAEETTTEAETEAETEEEYDFTNYTETATSGIVDEDVYFYLLPSGYKEYTTEHVGTYETVYYTTDVYGETVEKYAVVYLPYGYDADDTETKYNVIYFQHGSGGYPEEFQRSSNVANIINNIFDPDHAAMEQCIIVYPTYYVYYDETTGEWNDEISGDELSDGTVEANYYLEVVQDLIPAVESQYNVYCEDFSEEGIIATRDHRAWTGYSRGSMCTWYMFHYDYAYFAYWMPMSFGAVNPDSGSSADSLTMFTGEELYEYLKEAIDEYPDLDFFLFATTGNDSDEGSESMLDQLTYVAAQTDTFSFGLDPEENNFYFCRSDLYHADLVAPYSWVNAADILFK